MAVNTLVTGMIVFRILMATGVNPTLVGGKKLYRHIMLIIIESGMALFAIHWQLVRIVLLFISAPVRVVIDFVTVINQMLNVIII